jgi:hypothetical protein
MNNKFIALNELKLLKFYQLRMQNYIIKKFLN